MVLGDFIELDKLLQFSYNHPNIIFYDKTISNLDFEIDVEVKNRAELMKLLAAIKEQFSIRETEILSFKKYHKLELIPEK